MLAELALYAFSPGRLSIRRIGLFGQAVALWSRAARCRKAWAAHEERCKAVVRRAMAALPQRRTAVVLGSGLCRDVPLQELAAGFARVVLIDAVHLWPVRVKVKRLPNVELRSRDLTGAVDWLLGKAAARTLPLGDFHADASVDLVISANLLSQLPLGLDRWLDADERRLAQWGDCFSDQAIGWHLADLAGFACPVCLLSDVRYSEVTPDGRVMASEDLLRGHNLPPPEEEWEWEVAPLGEESRAHARLHLVQAWADVRPALVRT